MIPGRPLHPADAKPKRSKTARQRYRLAYPYCQCCGISREAAPWPGLSLHHLIKPGRSDEWCNFLMLCDRCHRLAGGLRIPDGQGGYWPILTLGVQLALKKARVSTAATPWNPERLAQLYCEHLPDLEAIPEVFEELYLMHQGIVS